MQLQPDTLFDNRYTLRELIGRGGFSEVWLAHDTWTELDIAIKVYAPGQGMDSDGLQIFSKELAGVFNLNHANLLKPTHVGQWLSMPYLIMEYCPNGALNKRVGKLTEQEVWKVLHDVASGLAYLHGKDIVHQDIKPDNILLDENGDYRITDFGISTKARTTLRRSIGAAAVSGGTTAYMAPERFSANPAPTKASDIWSLGAMVYELITGDVPFGEIGGGLQKNGAEIPTMQAATGTVSSKLEHVVRLMLAPNAWDRPTAETLAFWAADPDALKLRSNDSQTGTRNTTNGGAATETGTAGNNGSAKDNVSNSNNAGASCGRETTIFQPGSQPTTPATPRQRNTPHEGKPRVVNKAPLQNDQPQTEEKKKKQNRWLWVFWVFWVVLGLLIVTSCMIECSNNNREMREAEKIRQERLQEEKRQREIEEDKRNTQLSVSVTDIVANRDGDTSSFTIHSNREWKISGCSSWILCTKEENKVNVSFDYNPTKSVRNGFIDIQTTNNARTQRINIEQAAGSSPKLASSYIYKIWADHNITINGQIGMILHAHFTVSYKFNQNLTLYGFFKYRDGELLKDYDKKYASNGYVYIGENLKPNYAHCEWKDFHLFMPYEQLDFTKGTLNDEPLRVDIGIWDNEKSQLIGDMKTFNFNVTY